MKKVRPAFTLIELLVVIGLIAVLAGVLGMALGRGNSGTALQSAQGTTSVMISGARAEAAKSLLDAAVLINVTPGSDGFLRELRIATTTDDGVTWIDTGTVNEFPAGIHLVPNSGFLPASVTFTGNNPTWAANFQSSAFSGVNRKVKDTDGNADVSSDDYRVFARFTPRGTTTTGTLSRVVLSPADRLSENIIQFGNAAALRGMSISRYGVSSLINEPSSF